VEVDCGPGGDRRNTYPVSFTLWLQLIRNRLSFERFSIDRLRRVARKEERSLRAVPRATERNRKGKRERKREKESEIEKDRERKKEREREKIWPAGGLTLSPRQLHPVFYARLFRRAFTVARPFSSALILPFLFRTLL